MVQLTFLGHVSNPILRTLWKRELLFNEYHFLCQYYFTVYTPKVIDKHCVGEEFFCRYTWPPQSYAVTKFHPAGLCQASTHCTDTVIALNFNLNWKTATISHWDKYRLITTHWQFYIAFIGKRPWLQEASGLLLGLLTFRLGKLLITFISKKIWTQNLL